MRGAMSTTCSSSSRLVSELPAAGPIYDEYLRVFERRWGIGMQEAVALGAYAKPALSAEFEIRGKAMYQDSVLMAIRNACYQAHTAKLRYHSLEQMGLEKNVFDYGCGIGFLTKYMTAAGHDAVGYDLPGVQTDIANAVGCRIQEPTPENLKGRTIICLNVIEHLEEPLAFTRDLLETGCRVIANVCMDRCDKQHIAPYEELLQCRALLAESGSGANLVDGKDGHGIQIQ
jgi:hypothetical protein